MLSLGKSNILCSASSSDKSEVSHIGISFISSWKIGNWRGENFIFSQDGKKSKAWKIVIERRFAFKSNLDRSGLKKVPRKRAINIFLIGMCKTVKKVQSSATYFSSLLHFSDSSVSVKGQKAIDNNQYAFFSHIYVLSARQCTRWELARDEEGTKKCIKMMELDNLWLRAKKEAVLLTTKLFP